MIPPSLLVFPLLTVASIGHPCAVRRWKSTLLVSLIEDGRTSCDLRGVHGSVAAVVSYDGEHCSKFRSNHPSKLARTSFLTGGLGCFQLRASTSTAI